jgi:hypothetical protein
MLPWAVSHLIAEQLIWIHVIDGIHLNSTAPVDAGVAKSRYRRR